jgi:hypothetical protein
MKQVKCVYYAYPSSNVAYDLGYRKTGCWFLHIGDEDDEKMNIKSHSRYKDVVVGLADDYDLPWGSYSLYKGSREC